MKTKIETFAVTTAIYSLLFILIASIAFGSELPTNPPVTSAMNQTEIAFEEENYIEDIPFNTKEVVKSINADNVLLNEFDFEEEAYIDDIPVNTKEVVNNIKVEKKLLKLYDFEEEAYVDDIPFDTDRIATEVFFIYYYSSK